MSYLKKNWLGIGFCLVALGQVISGHPWWLLLLIPWVMIFTVDLVLWMIHRG
jgi:hypothetical protein